MPLYAYKCPQGHAFDRLLPLARYDEVQQCHCGEVAEKQLSAPAIRADYAGYQCPITGNWIEGKRAHEENLARHDCRIFEPGEREAMIKRKEAEELAFDNKIADTAAEFVEKLPSAKREQLGRELETGADVTVERQ